MSEVRRRVGVRIVTDPDVVTRNTQVYLDGVLVPRLRNIRFEHHVGDLPCVVLHVLPDFVELEAQAEIRRTHAGLQELMAHVAAVTPPPDQTLAELADLLDALPRTDDAVTISDTLARRIAEALRWELPVWR
jgi:hypothetical protein